MKKTVIFFYGVAAYVAFLGVFLYAIGFIGNFAVPKSLDSPASAPIVPAVLVDLGLLSIIALQHSIMARRPFKHAITRVIPAPAERSTYVLASSLALALLYWQWQPLGGVIWNVESAIGRSVLYASYAFGWALVLIATFVINHFDLFGLRQVWRELRGQPQANIRFVVPFLYRIVRHPLYVGWLCVFWSTPTMSLSHLLFAVMTTAYILVAIRFEEADLVHVHPEYAAYRKQVPMLMPRLTRDISFAHLDRWAASPDDMESDDVPAPRRAGTYKRAILPVAIGAVVLVLSSSATAQVTAVAVPPVPANMHPPAGNSAYLKGSAVGTQNHM